MCEARTARTAASGGHPALTCASAVGAQPTPDGRAMWSGARESKLARLEMLASISTNVLKHREPLVKVLRGQQGGREEKMTLLLRQRVGTKNF